MKKSSCWSAAASLRCQAPQTFPAKTPIHFSVVELTQRSGADLARGVHDARQRWQVGLHAGQKAGDVVRVGDIGRGDPDFTAVLVAQCVDALLGGVAGLAPAGQHQLLGAVRGQVSGDLEPDGAEPSGDQIRCVSA